MKDCCSQLFISRTGVSFLLEILKVYENSLDSFVFTSVTGLREASVPVKQKMVIIARLVWLLHFCYELRSIMRESRVDM